jgi:hypothetical protein
MMIKGVSVSRVSRVYCCLLLQGLLQCCSRGVPGFKGGERCAFEGGNGFKGFVSKNQKVQGSKNSKGGERCAF